MRTLARMRTRLAACQIPPSHDDSVTGGQQWIDRSTLDAYAQSTAKGHIRAKQNKFLPQVNSLIIHIPQFSFEEIWKKMKLNEPGRQTETR